MKAYGYTMAASELRELGEVTLQGSPSELRSLARFILDCADRMELERGWEHEHFRASPYASAVESVVDVVIFRTSS
jgi:hypothetical protein